MFDFRSAIKGGVGAHATARSIVADSSPIRSLIFIFISFPSFPVRSIRLVDDSCWIALSGHIHASPPLFAYGGQNWYKSDEWRERGTVPGKGETIPGSFQSERKTVG